MTKRIRIALALTTALTALPLIASAASAQTLPSGPSIDAQSGSDTVSYGIAGNVGTLNLGNNQRTIVNWNDFGVGSGYTMQFQYGGAGQGAVLNRVIGGSFSSVNGNLSGPANLDVFLLNPNGIMFGADANVNVGGFIASTLGLADADFMDGSAYNFSGTGTTAVIANSGAEIVTTGASSPLMLVGGSVDSSGRLSSTGDVVLAAASDIIVSFGAGSPLWMTINQGTPYSDGVEVHQQVTGDNIYLATAGRAGVSAMLRVDGWLTATTATATDRGVVLAAGTSASGITVASGGGNDTGGMAGIYIDGFVSADDGGNPGNVANVEIRAGHRVTSSSVQASDAIQISSNSEHVIARNSIIAGGDVNISAADAVYTKAPIRSTAGDISISASSIKPLADMYGHWEGYFQPNAGGDINISGSAEHRDIALVAGGSITAGNLSALDDIVVRAGGTAELGNLASGAALGPLPGDISTGADVIAGGTLTGQDIDVVANGLTFDNATANGTGSDVRFKGGSEDLVIGAASSITGTEVVLSTDQAFINNSGADAITASNRWLVYSANPSDNSFGGLDSGNTAIWNGTIGSVAPSSVSGNRYVFAYQPTLTVTTSGASKVYGTDLSGSAGTFYSISGYQPGVTGAFVGDTAATAYSGAPVISSGGFAERASVAGSPYTVTATAGTLASGSGYAFAFDNAGSITVTPKGISGTVTADDKTYDGNATGSGSVALTGVVSGDSVGTSTGSFTFDNENAGTDKTVTVSGVTLTGADAGNYTLTLPATALADILQRAITGTIIANDKTYDGTTAGTGAVTLAGVVAGDSVGTSAGSFTFDNEDAGTDKTVTVNGVTLTGADAGNYTLTLPATALADILQRAITGTITANDKTYDGNVTGSGSIALTGVVAGDSVGTSTGSFTFDNDNAGSDKTVTVSGVTLTGADADNYTLTLPATALADILQRAITGTITANDKSYDGTTASSGSVALNGLVAGDSVGTSAGSFTFADKNAGSDKTVTVSGVTLTGADAGNYTLTLPATALADILQRAITGTITANDKTYDGNAAGSGSVALTGIVAGDTVGTSAGSFAFDNENAGTDKTVTVSGVTLTGADAGNYTLTLPATALADILQRAITGTITANDKSYDGTTAGSGSVALNGLVAGDSVGTSAGSFTFADKNAGSDKTVTVSGVTLTGADAGNYTLTLPATALADILQRAITGAIAVDDKTYDGTTTGTGSIALTGVVSGDAVGTGGATFTFADKNAGTDKTVTVSGVTLTGADAGNYTLTLPESALADILKRVITIAIPDASITAGQPDPDVVPVVIAGTLVAGDAVTGEPSREAGTAPGEYAWQPGSLAVSPNYEVSFVGGTLTILPEETSVEPLQIDPLRSVALPAHVANPSAPSSISVTVDPSLLCADGEFCLAE